MKKLTGILLCLLMMLSLAACAQKEPALTWQEQYDLGVRYLSEGNYEEAVLAFTAAIEIEPKRAEAYLGLADVYIAQGDIDQAREILEQALEAVGENAELTAAISALQASTEEPDDVDMTPAAAQGGSVSFSGAGREMTLSLQWPDLPTEVYADGRDAHSAVFTMSVSDGKETFRVWTNLEDGTAGILTVPVGDAWSNRLSAAHHPEDDADGVVWRNLSTPVEVSRSGDTLTWNIQLPKGSFAASDVRYVGYFLYYSLSADDDKSYGAAAYAVESGTLVKVSDDILEDLGYVLTEAEMDARYFR